MKQFSVFYYGTQTKVISAEGFIRLKNLQQKVFNETSLDVDGDVVISAEGNHLFDDFIALATEVFGKSLTADDISYSISSSFFADEFFLIKTLSIVKTIELDAEEIEDYKRTCDDCVYYDFSNSNIDFNNLINNQGLITQITYETEDCSEECIF